MNRKQKLAVISTVSGIMREQIALVTNTNLIYNPYLIALGTVAEDMLNPEMIMIDTEKDDDLIEFYKVLLKTIVILLQVLGRRMYKSFYNTFISTKIPLVNMIQDIAVKKGNMNVDVVTEALSNSTKRIMSSAYMKAGMGDGGSS